MDDGAPAAIGWDSLGKNVGRGITRPGEEFTHLGAIRCPG